MSHYHSLSLSLSLPLPLSLTTTPSLSLTTTLSLPLTTTLYLYVSLPLSLTLSLPLSLSLSLPLSLTLLFKLFPFAVIFLSLFFLWQIWAGIVQIMTLLSIAVVILETVPSLRIATGKDNSEYLDIALKNNSHGLKSLLSTIPCASILLIENITVIFLSVELVLRFFFSPCKKLFFTKFLNLCDLVSMLPCYIIALLLIVQQAAGPNEYVAKALIILGIARIIRIFRLCHMAKHYQTVQIIASSLIESHRELLLLLILLLSTSVFFAACLFYSELHIDNIDHIPLAIWWALVTMTTVGYGDYYPISAGGYFVASLCSIAGILILALPTPIVVNNFSRLYDIHQTCQRIAQRQNSVSEKTSDSAKKGKNSAKTTGKNVKLRDDMIQLTAVQEGGSLDGSMRQDSPPNVTSLYRTKMADKITRNDDDDETGSIKYIDEDVMV